MATMPSTVNGKKQSKELLKMFAEGECHKCQFNLFDSRGNCKVCIYIYAKQKARACVQCKKTHCDVFCELCGQGYHRKCAEKCNIQIEEDDDDPSELAMICKACDDDSSNNENEPEVLCGGCRKDFANEDGCGFEIGQLLLVEFDFVLYNAVVSEINEEKDELKIHFVRWSKNFDGWYKMDDERVNESLACDSCNQWFHIACLPPIKSTGRLKNTNYVCEKCFDKAKLAKVPVIMKDNGEFLEKSANNSSSNATNSQSNKHILNGTSGNGSRSTQINISLKRKLNHDDTEPKCDSREFNKIVKNIVDNIEKLESTNSRGQNAVDIDFKLLGIEIPIPKRKVGRPSLKQLQEEDEIRKNIEKSAREAVLKKLSLDKTPPIGNTVNSEHTTNASRSKSRKQPNSPKKSPKSPSGSLIQKDIKIINNKKNMKLNSNSYTSSNTSTSSAIGKTSNIERKAVTKLPTNNSSVNPTTSESSQVEKTIVDNNSKISMKAIQSVKVQSKQSPNSPIDIAKKAIVNTASIATDDNHNSANYTAIENRSTSSNADNLVHEKVLSIAVLTDDHNVIKGSTTNSSVNAFKTLHSDEVQVPSSKTTELPRETKNLKHVDGNLAPPRSSLQKFRAKAKSVGLFSDSESSDDNEDKGSSSLVCSNSSSSGGRGCDSNSNAIKKNSSKKRVRSNVNSIDSDSDNKSSSSEDEYLMPKRKRILNSKSIPVNEPEKECSDEEVEEAEDINSDRIASSSRHNKKIIKTESLTKKLEVKSNCNTTTSKLQSSTTSFDTKWSSISTVDGNVNITATINKESKTMKKEPVIHLTPPRNSLILLSSLLNSPRYESSSPVIVKCNVKTLPLSIETYSCGRIVKETAKAVSNAIGIHCTTTPVTSSATTTASKSSTNDGSTHSTAKYATTSHKTQVNPSASNPVTTASKTTNVVKKGGKSSSSLSAFEILQAVASNETISSVDKNLMECEKLLKQELLHNANTNEKATDIHYALREEMYLKFCTMEEEGHINEQTAQMLRALTNPTSERFEDVRFVYLVNKHLPSIQFGLRLSELGQNYCLKTT